METGAATGAAEAWNEARAVGLRERKKAATRRALHEAAFRLAAEHGLDQVTVEAIADAAAVSRRTFSNYFSSKEEAIAYGEAARLRRLLTLLRAEPPGQPVRAALAHAVRRLITEADVGADWAAARRRLRGHPALRAHQVAAYAALERDLAAELAHRLGGDADQGDRRGAEVTSELELRARVVAATTLAALRAATQLWIDDPSRPLAAMVDAALRHAVED